MANAHEDTSAAPNRQARRMAGRKGRPAVRVPEQARFGGARNPRQFAHRRRG